MKDQAIIFRQLVSYFGTQNKTAKALDIEQATVSGWVTGKHGMSAGVALRAEKLTAGKFTAAQLCPSQFSEPPLSEAASQ